MRSAAPRCPRHCLDANVRRQRIQAGRPRRRAAHLRRGDVEAAELLNDSRDLPGADALEVHLGDGQRHRPFAPDAPFQRPGIERPPIHVVVATGLGNPQIHLADSGLEGLRLESVGVALTVAGSLASVRHAPAIDRKNVALTTYL